jgi:hypothetical protein
LRRFWHVLGWLVTVEVLMIIFGVATAPLLLAFVTDIAVVILLIRSCTEMRAAPPVSVRSVIGRHNRDIQYTEPRNG